jgi:hypothetical protein
VSVAERWCCIAMELAEVELSRPTSGPAYPH